jgi:hypothetical protein
MELWQAAENSQPVIPGRADPKIQKYRNFLLLWIPDNRASRGFPE